jgi:hypothetical protein
MSRKNNVQVSKQFYSIAEKDGKKAFTLSDSFKSTIIRDAGSIGDAVHNMRAAAAGKAELALNITAAFDAAKEGGFTTGLPEFVHTYIDQSCPAGYGKVGTPARATITSHKVFTGIEAMVKNARQALKLNAERQKLIAAGKNPEDVKEVREYNKESRDLKAEQFQKSFCKAIVGFDKHGITETTISNFLILVLRKVDKDSEELNKAGQDLRDAAIKALFVARGMKQEEGKTLEETAPASKKAANKK